MRIDEMKNFVIRTVDSESLVDVSEISINDELLVDERTAEFIIQVKCY